MGSSEQNRERIKCLVEKAKTHDAHAFALLYEMVYEDLYKMAYYTLGNQQDAEDVVSDTVMDAYAGIRSLKDETAFRGWIFRILSYKCKRMIGQRIRDREHLFVEKDAESQTEIADGHDEMEQVLNQQILKQAFAAVSEEERLIVTMSVYGGYDSRQISKILHKNRNTVRSKYKRALEKMRKVL